MIKGIVIGFIPAVAISGGFIFPTTAHGLWFYGDGPIPG
jgi:hypothetical protein